MDNNKTKEEGKIRQWLKKHKALIIGGVVALGIVAFLIAFLLLKRKPSAKEVAAIHDAISNAPPELIDELIDSVTERKRPTEPVQVTEFLRKLHEGWHASKEQLEKAKSLGIDIPDGFTFVQAYTKYKDLPACA